MGRYIALGRNPPKGGVVMEGNDKTRRELLTRIRNEFDELPGLKLTIWQACRLWNLAVPLCEAMLGGLIDEHFLRRTADGIYVHASIGRRSIRASEPDWLPRLPDHDYPPSSPDIPDDESRHIDIPHEPDPERDVEFIPLGV